MDDHDAIAFCFSLALFLSCHVDEPNLPLLLKAILAQGHFLAVVMFDDVGSSKVVEELESRWSCARK